MLISSRAPPPSSRAPLPGQAQQKGTKSSKSAQSKLLTSQSHLSQLGSTLTTSLPSFLAQSQTLDRSHAAFLKESLVRHGTICSDLGRERMEMGERLLVGVFEVDERAEMQGWALREGHRTASGAGAGDGSLNGSGAGRTGHLNEFGSTGRASGSPRTESIMEEREGQMLPPPIPSSRERQSSTHRAPPPPVAPVPVPTNSSAATSAVKSGGSKLKGLFKRDRSSSAAGSSKYGNLDGPGLGSSTNMSHQPDRISIASSRETESLAEQPEQPTAQHPSFNRSVSAASSSMGHMPPPIQPDKTPKKRDSLMPFSNGGPGGLFRRASKMTSGASPMASPAAAERTEPRLSDSPVAENVDEEGFSVPPAGYDRQPWEQAANASGRANLMDGSDDEGADGLASITPGSRLPAVALAPAAITETNEDRAAALAKVQSALLSSPPSTGAASPLGGLAAPPSNLQRRTTRGRRDVRMTMYQPSSSSTDEMPLANLQQRARQQSAETNGSFISPPISPIPTGVSGFGEPGRANSIMSTTSGSTAARGLAGVRDPFEGESAAGLRASIVETVNVLSKGGEVSRVMIQGELSLSHKPASGQSEPLRIRITHFEQFEKAAPNSAYIQPVADSPGEYTLLPSLAAHGSTATVLKYQVFVSPGQEAYFTPLHVKAAWKTEPTLTRVMVTFEPNPSAVFAGRASSAETSPFGEDDDGAAVQLEDVAFLLPVNAAVTTFQAKPGATWSADKRRLGFSVEPIRLSSEVGEGKLLASLTTESQATAQPVAVRWRVVGRTVSAVGVEVVGQGGSKVEEVRRATVTGKYLVAP